jgi:hypothetical protein
MVFRLIAGNEFIDGGVWRTEYNDGPNKQMEEP